MKRAEYVGYSEDNSKKEVHSYYSAYIKKTEMYSKVLGKKKKQAPN
jgi:hypothetical protein